MVGTARKSIMNWLGIVFGCVVMSVGYVLFINPYSIVPGGIYGASIVLHSLFPSIQVGWFGYMMDIPLLIIATVFLGAKLGGKTIAASLISPAIMNTISYFIYPDKESLQALDPSKMLGGVLDLSGDLTLAVLAGSVMIGIGCGIVIRSGATTGGTDIIAMLIQKFFHIRFSRAIMIADGAVVIFGLVVIGFIQGEPVSLFLYSLAAVYLISRILARTISGAKDDKILYIISDKPNDILRDYILKDLDRTATKIKSSGLYSDADKEMIFLVVSYKEVAGVKAKIHEADPRAFVVVTDAYDTYGEGWKSLPHPDDLQPE